MALLLSACLICANFNYASASTATTSELPEAGTENTDKVAEMLISEGDFTAEQEENVYEGVELLSEVGIPIEDIEAADEENGDIVYELAIGDDVKSQISDIDAGMPYN